MQGENPISTNPGEPPLPAHPVSTLGGYGPDIVHSSLYLPEPVYEALRETAFKERCKIHDLVLEGIGLALRKRGVRRLAGSR
jgi:hypothetical protein